MEFTDLVKVSYIKKLKFQPFDITKIKEILPLVADDHFAKIEGKLGGGIYRMYDSSDQVIYVGKSNDLQRRFHEHLGKRSNTAYFIDQVERIEFFREDNPIYFTLLESIFIAYHEPKYNDEVKDHEKMG